MCNNNKLIIAAAGSGKTTFLVKEALKRKEAKILITTYTQSNEEEIHRKFIKLNNCIPENITVQTWFSFLLQHGVKPFQGHKFKEKINGLILVNGISAIGINETDTKKHYFTKDNYIFSDKLSKFVICCNNLSEGSVINRLSRIYTDIFIDEVQDLAGYDLEFLKLLFSSSINTLLVGDPRQGTYSTNNATKNKKFKKSNIVYFFEDDSIRIDTDNSSLTTNYRSCKEICDLSNELFPDYSKTTSGNSAVTGHDGIFIVKTENLEEYLVKYNPMQLRDSIKTKVNDNYPVITFGKSKGMEFERVLIYPTQPFLNWLKDRSSSLQPTSRAKFYVAITRAKQSVAILQDNNI